MGEEPDVDDTLPVRAVLDHYCLLINPTPSSVSIAELQSFVDKLGPEICDHAIDIAADENKRGWAYVRSILSRYEREGVTSIGQVVAQEQQYKQRKSGDTAGRDSPRSKRKSYAELAAEMDAKEGQS